MRYKYIRNSNELKKISLAIVILLGLSTTMLLKDPLLLVCYTLLFIGFIRITSKTANNDNDFLLWRLYYIYIIISAIRGLLFYTEIYFDYKFLVFNSFELILPVMMAWELRNKETLSLFYGMWLRWGIFFALLTIPFIPGYQVGKSFTAIMFLAIFFKELSKKYQIISLAIIVTGLLLNDGSRSVIVRSAVFVLISACTYIPFVIKKLKPIILITFFIPICLFMAACFTNFNILKLGEENTEYTIKDNGASGAGEEGSRSLTADTRTVLYEESLNSAIKNRYILFGITPARGHESSAFEGGENGTRKGERNKDEIGMLNLFNWFGVTGVILYSGCFLYSIWLGLYRSKNTYTIYGAIMLQFFWIYSWLEEIQIARWDYLIIFLIVPFITSRSFRRMNNNEVKVFINQTIK